MLGWVVPITITGKLIFSDVCNKNLTWDEPVPPDVEKRWKVWMYMLEQSKNTEVPRSVQTHAGSYFKLHGFSDVSNLGLCEAIYVLEYINTKPFFTISTRCQIKNQTKRAKYTKAGIDSCSHASKVATKHTCIIRELSNHIMPLLGRQHNRIILVAY